MANIRKIAYLKQSRGTLEGAGVKLKRAFGYDQLPKFDPFLLLDDFGSDNPADYLAGFPWHPHRGIETVTYVLHGDIEHQDSLGNKGSIKDGEVQWMTAGSGIIHQEMPQEYDGVFRGFQLWVNLPQKSKMIDPKYRGLSKQDIKEVDLENGSLVKVVSGEFRGVKGPVKESVVDVTYLDVTLAAGEKLEHQVDKKYNAFAYVVEGGGVFEPEGQPNSADDLILFSTGDKVEIVAGQKGVRFLLIFGEPLREPIAWRGPIVMNTDEEINQAFFDYQSGNFVKK